MADVTGIPSDRRPALGRVLEALLAAQNLVLTTHVNADGDGAGCEAALAAWLAARGKRVTIVNPTPFPEAYRYLVDSSVAIADFGTDAASDAIRSADLFVVLDTAEPRRLGRMAKMVEGRPTAVIDHHPDADPVLSALGVVDPRACATGELIHDLLTLADPPPAPWPAAVVEGIYVAIVTDTGSFRFSNTSARAHAIAADLLDRGIDPEAAFRRIYGSVPLRRIHLLRAALERLEVDPAHPIAWITIPAEVMAALGASSEDLEGIIEHARTVEQTEVAVLFRELPDGGTKVSFRSNGEVDVNAIARRFGGGGHVKAAGALVGAPLDAAREEVLDAVREAVHRLERQAPGG
ncbi:MAG TPA: DHH family phosphoesterase [Longimicrobiales bacterium]|nr:DHH family phosphoesterase [Longimicrobiales bacterium]